MGPTHLIAVAILSVWLAATLFVWFAATRTFSTVERILRKANPQFVETSKPLGEDQTRVLLRYLASEINRAYFWWYGVAQILLAALLLLLLWRQTPRDAIALAVVWTMLGLVLVLTLVVTPLVVSLGQRLDFVPRTPPPPLLSRFWALHGAFTGLDGVKLLAGLGLLVRWILAR